MNDSRGNLNFHHADYYRLLQNLQAWLEAEVGGTLLVGVEFEFQVPIPTRVSPWSLANYCRDALFARDIIVESVRPESYPGQLEAVIGFERYATSVAGKIVRLTAAIKSIQDELHSTVSSLVRLSSADYYNGMHVNISLHDASSINLFDAEARPFYPNLIENAIEGLCRVMNESMIFFCPDHSSYSRILSAREHRSPQSPSNVSWGGDNRTVAIRVTRGSTGPRLEHRVPGADSNPYLSLASILAGIGYGVHGKLELARPKVWGDAQADHPDFPRLVTTLADARRAFDDSGVLRGLLESSIHMH